MSHAKTPLFIALTALALGLSGCGGGIESDDAGPTGVDAEAVDAEATAAADERESALAVGDPRLTAAQNTANSTSNGCAAIRPFYWEIGNRDGRQASGAVIKSRTGTVYTATTQVPLASASKWLYAAYVVQRKAGQVDADDIRMLTMRSGHASLGECLQNQTVQSCLDYGNNGTYTAAWDNSFYYDGGHMQKHASVNGLAAATNATLGVAVRAQLGKDIVINYARPQPAGGAVANADAYAKFLRKLLKGELRLGSMLGSHAACTSPSLCPAGQATWSPVEQLGNVHYSLGHWVEDDPSGDGAFSSGGTLGFYPWIDAGKTTYGVVSRVQTDGGPASRWCGRLIRKAWMTGKAQ